MAITENTILEIVESHFPMAIGIVLTGSQSKNSEFTDLADIDVVVFDFQLSVVSTTIITVDKITIDVTLIPLYDIENVLFNESFHVKGTLLSMLVKGKTLKDTTHIVAMIRDKATVLYQKRNSANDHSYFQSIGTLKQLSTSFTKKMPFEERFVLINNFINLMIQAEVTSVSNWSHSGKHKARFLNECDGNIIKEVISISKQYMFNEANEDLTPLSKFINYYTSNLKRHYPTTNEDRYVIDISYPNISVENFHQTVIKALKTSSILCDQYLYLFSSPVQFNRIFTNRLSMVFQTSSGEERRRIYELLGGILSNNFENRFKISNAATYIFSEKNQNRIFYYLFEDVAKEISIMIDTQIDTYGRYDNERSLNIGIILFSTICKQIDFSLHDMDKCLAYLTQRYLLSYAEQSRMKSVQDLTNYRNGKLQMHHLYYFKNKELFISMVKKGFRYDTQIAENANKEYSKVVSSLNILIERQTKQYDALNHNNPITSEVLGNYCQVQEVEKATLFVLIFEQLTQLLHFDFNQKGLSLFIMICSLNELRNPTIKNDNNTEIQSVIKN